MTEGQRMLFIRKLIKKSQQEFSQLLSVSQAALSDIENGKNGVSYPVFKKLVEEAGIHPYWFMWEQEPMFRDPAFIEKYHGSDVAASPTVKNAVGKAVVQSDVTLEKVMQSLAALKEEVAKMYQRRSRQKK